MTDAKRNLYVSLLVLGLILLFLYGTLSLSPQGRVMPQIVGVIGLVLCVLDVIAHTDTDLGRRVAMVLSGSTHLPTEEAQPRATTEFVAFAWIIGATAAIVVFGFLLATPAYVLSYMVIQGRKSVVQSVIAAVVTTLFIWVVFEILMEYEVYRGLLFSDL